MTRVAPGQAEVAATYVSRRAGVSPTGPRRDDLVAAIVRSMAHAGASTAECFIRLLERDRTLFDELVVVLTVPESYFLREPRQLELLVRRVLPERAEARGPSGRLRLWSAGCAAGQEAYTLAILLDEAGLGPRSDILASDVSEQALDAARRGVYGKWSLRAVDERRRRTYFRPVPGGFQIRPRLARSITFRRSNLLDPAPGDLAAGLDVVLCRNVLVYLTPDAVEQVARRLVDSLAPGGWIITASTDPSLDGTIQGLDTVMTPDGIAYRRATAGAAEDEPSPVVIAPARSVRTAGPHAERAWSDRRGASPPALTGPSPVSARDAAKDADHDMGTSDAAAPSAKGDAEADAALVRTLAGAGRLGAAADAVAEAINRFPLHVELRLLQAMVMLELGRAREAVAAGKAAVYLDPDVAMAHLTLARAEQAAGGAAATRRGFRNALNLLEALPGDHPVPLSDGETAGRLANLARAGLRGTQSPTGTAATP